MKAYMITAVGRRELVHRQNRIISLVARGMGIAVVLTALFAAARIHG